MNGRKAGNNIKGRRDQGRSPIYNTSFYVTQKVAQNRPKAAVLVVHTKTPRRRRRPSVAPCPAGRKSDTETLHCKTRAGEFASVTTRLKLTGAWSRPGREPTRFGSPRELVVALKPGPAHFFTHTYICEEVRRLSFRASASHGESHYQSASLPVRVPAAPVSLTFFSDVCTC